VISMPDDDVRLTGPFLISSVSRSIGNSRQPRTRNCAQYTAAAAAPLLPTSSRPSNGSVEQAGDGLPG